MRVAVGLPFRWRQERDDVVNTQTGSTTELGHESGSQHANVLLNWDNNGLHLVKVVFTDGPLFRAVGKDNKARAGHWTRSPSTP